MSMSRKRNTSFYKDKRWVSRRLKMLKHDSYECQNCKRFYRTREAKVIHHIYFYEDYPMLGLLKWNLVSLCNECHNRMHDRINDKATRLGLEWQEKRVKEFNLYFKNK